MKFSRRDGTWYVEDQRSSCGTLEAGQAAEDA